MTVLGTPITAEVAATYPQYQGQTITPFILSKIAMDEMNRKEGSDGLNLTATKTANGMKEEYGDGASTLVLIYNASGQDLNFANSYDWSGSVWKYAYDPVIKNGQWSCILHTHNGILRGSVATAIYRSADGAHDFFLGWDNPYTGSNRTYGAINEKNHWPTVDNWDKMSDTVSNSGAGSDNTFGPYEVTSSIGQSTSPILTFIIRRTA